MRVLVSGVWGATVSLSVAFGTMSWKAQHTTPQADAAQPSTAKMQVNVKLLSVPIIQAGAVQGYVIAKFIFSVDVGLYGKLPAPADVFLTDEAFKAVYGEGAFDFRHLEKQDLVSLGQKVLASANRRLGGAVVLDVLIPELNYITKREARGGQGP